MKTNKQLKETMDILNEISETPLNRKSKINNIDILYRELENFDEQYLVMFKVLNFLSNKQLEEITEEIKKQIKEQKKYK